MEPNNEQQRWEKIDAYLRGEFTDDERADFENQLTKDSHLTKEVDSIRQAGILVQSYGQREELKAIHQKMIDRQPDWPDIRFYLRVAAIIVFLVVAWAGISIATLTPDSLYKGEYTGYIPETVRDAESPSRPTTEQMIQTEYINANYIRVSELYKASPTKRIRETFLAGNAYLAIDQPGNATACFKRVMYLSGRENNFEYYQDAEYYLAWSYLKNNKLDEAIKMFEKIYNNEFHIHNPDLDRWFFWKLKLLQWKKR